MSVVFAQRALRDLEEIYAFHFARNPAYARRLVSELVKAGRSLSDFPDRGSPQPNPHGRPLRRLVENGHLIVYLIDSEGITILSVVHGLRDMDALIANLELS